MSQPKLNIITPSIAPLPQPITLDNGLEAQPIPHATLGGAHGIVVIHIQFMGGQWVEEKIRQSVLAVNLLTAGAGERSALTLTETLDRNGAELHTVSTHSYCYVQLTCLRRTLPQVLPLLCDILTRPTFEQTQLDIRKEEEAIALRMSKRRVAWAARKTFHQSLFAPSHPLAVYPEEEDIRSLTRADLAAYHTRHLSLSNAVAYLTGDIDEELLTLTNNHLGQIPLSAATPHNTPARATLPHHPSPAPAVRTSSIDVPSVQSALCSGRVMDVETPDDLAAIMLTSTLIGGYFGSRLMRRVRESEGLTYGINAAMTRYPDTRLLTISTETPRASVQRCIDLINNELDDLAAHPVTQEELDNARNYRLGQFCRMTETSLNLAPLLLLLRSQGRDLRDLQRRQEAELTLTPADIQQCAAKYFNSADIFHAVAHGKE